MRAYFPYHPQQGNELPAGTPGYSDPWDALTAAEEAGAPFILYFSRPSPEYLDARNRLREPLDTRRPRGVYRTAITWATGDQMKRA